MRTVRDRLDARWLPSRFRYAIFRLVAFGVIRRSRPREVRGLVLVVDRDQSASEYYLISAWLLLTVSCYVCAGLSPVTNGVVAGVAAIPIASLIMEAPMYLSGAVMPVLRAAGIRQESSLRVASMMLYGLLLLTAAYFALAESWVRYVAVSFFAIMAANAVAAVVVWSLRRRIAELEKTYGVAA